MRRLTGLTMGCLLVAAACGGSDDEGGGGTGTDAPPPATDAPEPEPTEAPEPEPTDPPEPEPTEAPEPEPTDPPDTTTTTEPPPPVNAVGLVPLPGSQLDFSARPAASPSLVWSLFSGSGGVIVENVGGPLPPGCHGTSFFDPKTFDLLQIDGKDLEAYATRGEGGCANMQSDLEAGVVDGDAVKINTDDLILFDFGALPGDPFDVSTQIVNPDGADGVFRSADIDALLPVNDLSGATHVVGASGLFEFDAGSGLPSRIVQGETAAGPGCVEFSLCLRNGRFQVDLVDASGSPGTAAVSDDETGLMFFADPDNWEVLVKVLDGCPINDHFWVFAAATTNVEFELTVTDRLSDVTQPYTTPSASEPILDTAAFATCP